MYEKEENMFLKKKVGHSGLMLNVIAFICSVDWKEIFNLKLYVHFRYLLIHHSWFMPTRVTVLILLNVNYAFFVVYLSTMKLTK